MRKLLQKFRRDDDGAAMVEYAVILGLITAAAITILQTMGTDVVNIFTKIQTALAAAA